VEGGFLFRILCAVLGGLRKLGWPAGLARLSPREADGYALAIAYMLKARWWTLRHGEPGWDCLQAEWASAEADPVVRDALASALSDADMPLLIAAGEDGFARRNALYAGARDRIDIATYYIQSDATGSATVAALAACVARGVRVRLLVDRYMMFKKRVEVEGMDELAARIRACGIEMKSWHDPRRPYDSNHRKMIVVDGHTALVGGRNFADHYRGDAWRDVDLVLEGPSVAPLAAFFDALWRGEPVGGGEPGIHRPWVESVPSEVRRDPIMRCVLSAIGSARATVDLELAYFVAHESLCGALERAARRGVRVRLLTNSAEANDLPYATWTAYAGMQRVLEAGGAVHGRRGAGRTLHCKYAVVDGQWVSFGSHNLDYYSPRFCGEANLLVCDARLGARLTEFFETGLAEAPPLSLEGEVRPFLQRHRALRLFDRVFRDFQ